MLWTGLGLYVYLEYGHESRLDADLIMDLIIDFIQDLTIGFISDLTIDLVFDWFHGSDLTLSQTLSWN
jgi:hypothetical protein